MPKPYQQPRPPMFISLASPISSSAKTAAEKGWGMISANIIPTYSVASHWTVYSDACRAMGKQPSGDSWRVARNLMVAPSDAEADDRVFGAAASNNYFYTYMREVLNNVGLLVILKPRADMPDDRGHGAGHHRRMRAARLAQDHARQARGVPRPVGPFGGLLMTGLDWGGPNAGVGARDRCGSWRKR